MRTDDEAPVSAWLLLLALLPCVVVAVLALAIVPRFQEIFAAFGGMVPQPTALLFASYRWWWLSCLVPIAAWWLWPRREQRGGAAIVVASLFAMLLMAFGVLALYLPFVHLAGRVG